MKQLLTTLTLVIGLAFANHAIAQQTDSLPEPWEILKTEQYPGKQDDLCFVDNRNGWYINGFGKIYRTRDGGNNWEKVFEKQGTFFRCVAFIDTLNGFVGTVGTDYFPNVTDTIPLYRTRNGGQSWEPVVYEGPYVKGLCAFDVAKETYINHGQTGIRNHIFAVGRVGSPAMMMVSHDNGERWSSWSMGEYGQMLFDIKMFDLKEGIACSATSGNVAESKALVLRTSDGGKTWKTAFEGKRNFELTWKASFPTRKIGYVTIQSYSPDTTQKTQRVLKTTNGGKSWQELNLTENYRARSFGVGFLNEDTGYVGTMAGGFETKDGGKTWRKVKMGTACNKIRFYNFEGQQQGYGIGVSVIRYKGKVN